MNIAPEVNLRDLIVIDQHSDYEALTENNDPNLGDSSELITDDIQQVCLARCRICNLVMIRNLMESHLKYKHSVMARNYGNFGFVRKTYTR